MPETPPDPQLVVDAFLNGRHPIKLETAAWARDVLVADDMIERDRDCQFSRSAWKAVAERGILASVVPTELGGSGHDAVTSTLILEGLGLGCRDNGLAFAAASQMLSFQDSLVRFGSDAQRTDVLLPAIEGDLIGAFAITEADSGSDTHAMATSAVKESGGWRLTGSKAHITLAPIADIVIVFAVTNPDAGSWGISAFVVHTDRPGVTLTPTHPKMGLRTTPFGDIHLDGYLAEPSDMLGGEGAGASIFAACMESERGLIMATHLGAAERVIDEAIERANTREQFGQPIGAFQAISHRLADMRLQHETARLLMYKAAASIATGGRATMEAAMAKLQASEAIASIALDASRIHGARGYVTSFEVEREVRDALGGLVYSGTSDVQKNLIAALMGVSSGTR
jgi:alkylation response protein AidB-like acyl-CoA dehydrogenase